MERLSRDTVVTTGDYDEEDAAEDAELARIDETRPWAVLICDEDETCATAVDELEAFVLSDEKVALGFRAFRTVKMTSEAADKEPLLEKSGKAVPRLVLLDIAREKKAVMANKQLKAKKVYAALRKTSDRFYNEKLDKIVKKHVKVLAEQDKLARAEVDLIDKKEKEAEDTESKKFKKLSKELDELREKQEELRKEAGDLWTLTAKAVS